jgi:hypothetical protein
MNRQSFAPLAVSSVLLALSALLPFAANADTHVSGSITTNTTWDSSNGVYIVDADVTVNNGVTLTVNPGTIVKFDNGIALIVANGGTLVAGSASATTVYFTSLKDDKVGGDTNGDGSATAPAAGNWDDIKLNSGASSTIVSAVVRYGGFNTCCSKVGADIYNAGGTLTLDNVTVATSTSYGIDQTSGTTNILGSDIHKADYGAFVTGGNMTISSSALHDTTNQTLYDQSSGSLTLTGDTFSNFGASAIYLYLNSGLAFTHSNNTASGSGPRAFYMDGSIGSDETWTGGDLPYAILTGLTVPSGKTLTIEEGAVVKLDNGQSLTIANGGALRVDLIPCFGTKLSMISDEGKGNRHDGEQA